MCGGNDFVTRFDAERTHRDIEGISPIRARDTMLDTQGISPSAFKRIHMATSDKRGLSYHACDSVVDRRLNADVLGVKVDEWNSHAESKRRC